MSKLITTIVGSAAIGALSGAGGGGGGCNGTVIGNASSFARADHIHAIIPPIEELRQYIKLLEKRIEDLEIAYMEEKLLGKTQDTGTIG